MPSRSRPLYALALVAACAFAPAALAGPPLICHPFTTGAGEPLLPWAEGSEWHLPDPGYDRTSLVADTLGLLSADAPILTRMENMRRAAIYADEDPTAAAALLEALVERTKTPAAAHAEALASFDAGYLVETYRQLGLIYRHEMRPAHGRWSSLVPHELESLDGYALLQRAIELAPEARAELEFAAALMSSEPLTTAHLNNAAARAVDGSLLAQNLAHYGLR
jgi:hypothetical protein